MRDLVVIKLQIIYVYWKIYLRDPFVRNKSTFLTENTKHWNLPTSKSKYAGIASSSKSSNHAFIVSQWPSKTLNVHHHLPCHQSYPTAIKTGICSVLVIVASIDGTNIANTSFKDLKWLWAPIGPHWSDKGMAQMVPVICEACWQELSCVVRQSTSDLTCSGEKY